MNFTTEVITKKSPWLMAGDVLPFVYVRPENQIANPGTRHKLNWFHQTPIYKNPLRLEELDFAESLYYIEGRAFGPANMAMPRWVFYDCAVIPGFVAGFCMKTEKLPSSVRNVLREPLVGEYTPLSLFIIIPTMHRGEWVAHNLCSINSILPRESQYYGLGFLSKAFGLWYANVEQCSGMTQWGGPALRLHANYGHLEVMGAYAPVHSHANTVTYRVLVDTAQWERFYTRDRDYAFLEKYAPTTETIDPHSEDSMKSLQRRIEDGHGPFFLSAHEIAEKKLDEPLTLYRSKTRSIDE